MVWFWDIESALQLCSSLAKALANARLKGSTDPFSSLFGRHYVRQWAFLKRAAVPTVLRGYLSRLAWLNVLIGRGEIHSRAPLDMGFGGGWFFLERLRNLTTHYDPKAV